MEVDIVFYVIAFIKKTKIENKKKNNVRIINVTKQTNVCILKQAPIFLHCEKQ